MIVRKTLRILYAKKDLIRFIGHLDVIRLMTRAIARSNIPAVYSEGFSPHMKASFGPSLPLGATSDCEYLDIAINYAEASETVDKWKGELQNYLPEGIIIRELKLLDEGVPTLAKCIDRVMYEITIPEEFSPGNEKLACFLQKEKIEVEKNSKHGISNVDIRQSVISLKRIDSGENSAKVIVYELVTIIGQAGYATPALILKYLMECDWKEIPGLKIHRKKLYSTANTL